MEKELSDVYKTSCEFLSKDIEDRIMDMLEAANTGIQMEMRANRRGGINYLFYCEVIKVCLAYLEKLKEIDGQST